jgi:hypothetical protein
VRPEATLVVVGGDGQPFTIDRFPDTELSIQQRVSFGVVFGRSIEIRARGDRIAVGNTDAFSIRIYSGSGQLLRVVRQARELPAVTRDDFERAKPASFPSTPVGAQMRAAVEQMPRPATYPAFGELRFDGGGNLWVQEFAREWDERRTWQIFSPEGRLLGRLEVPASHTLLDVSARHALVRVIDELGVHRVRSYLIER